jgi:hypothetical protein
MEAQHDLFSVLKEQNVEIVLDTNVAELSSIGRYKGSFRHLAWANPDRPLNAQDLKNADVVNKIAEFSVEHGVSTVLSPCRYLPELDDAELAADIEAAGLLRVALDELGAQHVAVDFPLLTKYASLRDSAHRRRCIARLRDAEFRHLWLRVSEYGSDAPASKIQRYIISASDYADLNKPVIADLVGGASALSLAAFNVVSGISHGVGSLERFGSSTWIVPPKPRNDKEDGFRQKKRVYLPILDRAIEAEKVEKLLMSRGAKQLLLCGDRDCCLHGVEMLQDPRAHFLYQREKQLLDLERIPDHRRAEHFVFSTLAHMSSKARKIAKLRIEDEDLGNILLRSSQGIEDKRLVLEKLLERAGGELNAAKPVKTLNSITRFSSVTLKDRGQ